MTVDPNIKNPLVWPVLAGLFIAFTSSIVGAEDPVSHPAKEVYEKYVQNLKQLTFGGQNAEAYFSLDGTN